MATHGAKGDPEVFKLITSQDVFIAADKVFELLKPKFDGPSALASVLTVIIVASWIAYRKDKSAGVEDLIEQIRGTWDAMCDFKLDKEPLH